MKLFIPKLKKLFISQEKTCLKNKNFLYFLNFVCLLRENLLNISAKRKKTVSNTFLNKEAKCSKLKYFLIILIKHAIFSFYNIFSYTQQSFVFRLLRDFFNVHDYFLAFFLFLL